MRTWTLYQSGSILQSAGPVRVVIIDTPILTGTWRIKRIRYIFLDGQYQQLSMLAQHVDQMDMVTGLLNPGRSIMDADFITASGMIIDLEDIQTILYPGSILRMEYRNNCTLYSRRYNCHIVLEEVIDDVFA